MWERERDGERKQFLKWNGIEGFGYRQNSYKHIIFTVCLWEFGVSLSVLFKQQPIHRTVNANSKCVDAILWHICVPIKTIGFFYYSLPIGSSRQKKVFVVFFSLTFSCLKKQSIFNSRKTLLDDTNDWNTFGSFLSATRRPSRGSVTALQENKKQKEK